MKKRSKYKRKYSLNDCIYRFNSLFDDKKHAKLEEEIIIRFKSRFNCLNQNLEQGTADIEHVSNLTGLVELTKVIDKYSSRLNINQGLKLYITANPIIKDIQMRFKKQGNVGYKNENEQEIIIEIYNNLLCIMQNMTNYAYDEFIFLLEKSAKNNKLNLFVV